MEKLKSPRFLCVLSLALLFGCDKDKKSDETPEPGMTNTIDLGLAKIRAIHLSPTAPAIDLFATGAKNASRVAGELSAFQTSAYADVDAGENMLMISAGGTALLTETRSLLKDRFYTIVVFGTPDALRLQVLEDEAPVSGSNLRARLMNVNAGVGPADVYLETADGGTSLIARGLEFGSASSFFDVSPSTRSLGLDTDRDGIADIFFTAPNTLDASQTIYVSNRIDGSNAMFIQSASGVEEMPARVTSNDPDPMQMPGTGPARIRVIHLSPDAPPVDVYVNGGSVPAVAGLKFMRNTDWLTVPAGRYDFDVAPAGTEIGNAVIRVRGLELGAGRIYTVAAIGNVANIRGIALEETAAEAGKIRIRAVHAGDGVGPVDVQALAPPAAPTVLDRQITFGNAGENRTLPPAAYFIGVNVDNDIEPELAFRLPALPAGVTANGFVVVDTMGVPFLAAELNDGTLVRIDSEDMTPARARVLHLSPDAPEVDVFVNGGSTPAVNDLFFGNGTGYLSLSSGTYRFDVGPGSGTLQDSILSADGVSLAAGVSYSAVAIGPVADIELLLLQDNYANLANGNIRIRAVHAAKGVGNVDVLVVPENADTVPLFTGLTFGNASATADVPAGAYRVGLDLDQDHVPELTYLLPHLRSGTVANIFATPSPNGSVYLVIQVEDGSTARVFAH